MATNNTLSFYAPTNTSPDAITASGMENPLNSYPSYTYSLSLHLLSASDWNNLSSGGSYHAKNVLIASGGRYGSDFIRNQFFQDDFYIDDLVMKSTVAPSEVHNASSNIEIHFNVTEPWGVTLLDRLIDATKSIGEPNYLACSYLLQIDFYGSNDAGDLVHPIHGQTKNIPIKLVSMDINVTSKGSEYKFTAVPYVHEAFSQQTQSNPANFEVVADTVQSFFGSPASGFGSIGGSQRTVVSFLNSIFGGGSFGGDTKFNGKSYGDALNAWQANLKKTNDVEIPDVVNFVFDPEIGSAKIVEGGKLPPADIIMADRSQQGKIAKGDNQSLEVDTNFNVRVFPVNTGTSIENLLSSIIKNSSYVRNQIKSPLGSGGSLLGYLSSLSGLQTQPFWWFKIIPTIKLLGYDNIRKRRARETTYYIQKYAIRNLKVDFGPGGIATKPVKLYNYIYTGLNGEILELDIKFNAAFYTAVTANPTKLEKDQGLSALDLFDIKIPLSGNKKDDPLQPNANLPSVGNQQNQSVGTGISATQVLAGDAVRSALSNAQGDMITLNMKIIGDPTYIQQDEIFLPPNMTSTVFGSVGSLAENTSIPTSSGEMYVQVTFTAPIDLDESTAPMMRFNPKYKTSLFSGMYKVIMVESNFSKGKFTQSLELVRQPKQPTNDYLSNSAKDSSALQRSSTFNYVPNLNLDIPAADYGKLGLSPIQIQQGTGTSATPTILQESAALRQSTIKQSQTSGVPYPNLADIAANAPQVPINQQNSPGITAP